MQVQVGVDDVPNLVLFTLHDWHGVDRADGALDVVVPETHLEFSPLDVLECVGVRGLHHVVAFVQGESDQCLLGLVVELQCGEVVVQVNFAEAITGLAVQRGSSLGGQVMVHFSRQLGHGLVFGQTFTDLQEFLC